MMNRRVCVVGLGYIGLPLASLLTIAGHTVTGVDINPEVLARISSHLHQEPEPELNELVNKALNTGNLSLSLSLIPAEIYIITVGTPLTPEKLPDLSHVNQAVDSILTFLQPGNAVFIESTCPIGTTSAIAAKINQCCPNILVAYCSERVLPGNIIKELVHNSRVIGGVDPSSTQEAVKFYQTFVRGEVVATDAKTAEAVKLAENTYRDINIAYANELSLLSHSLGIDSNEVIALANRHPRVDILKPGIGVGGHCIAIDPWFLVAAEPRWGQLTAKAREVNETKTKWVIQNIKSLMQENGASTVACLGLTYKPNVSDTRESPAMAIVAALRQDFIVHAVDPFVAEGDLIDTAIEASSLIIVLVAHEQFKKYFANKKCNKQIIDYTGECL